MKARGYLYFLGLLLPLCLYGGGAAAQDGGLLSGPAPLRFTGYYALSWRAIPLGGIAMEIRDDPGGGYSIRTLSESRGLAELFSAHAGDTMARGTLDARAGYLPSLYETRYAWRGKNIHIRLEFDAARNVSGELVEPPPNRATRPEVPAGMKKNVFDILSGFLQLRRMLYEAHLAGRRNFAFDVFDGNRLSRIHAVMAEELLLKLRGGERLSALRAQVTREPLAGYKEKELRQAAKGEPPLHLYFSQDERMIPLKGAIDYYGPLEGALLKECPSLETCGRPAPASPE